MCQRKKEIWHLVQQDAEAALMLDKRLMKVTVCCFGSDLCHHINAGKSLMLSEALCRHTICWGWHCGILIGFESQQTICNRYAQQYIATVSQIIFIYVFINVLFATMLMCIGALITLLTHQALTKHWDFGIRTVSSICKRALV